MRANGGYDWEDILESDGEEHESRAVLPEGDYFFEVEDLEKGEFFGSDKIPPCNKVRLTLKISDPDGGTDVRMKDDLILHRKLDWKLSGFFRSVGLKDRDEPARMDWDRVPGSIGRAHIRIKRFANGNEINRVTRYLDPDPEDDGFYEVPEDEKLPF